MSKSGKNRQNRAKNRDCARGRNSNRKFAGLFGSPISASRTDSKNCQKWSKNCQNLGNSHAAVNRIINLSGLENLKFWEIQNGVESGRNRQKWAKFRDCA